MKNRLILLSLLTLLIMALGGCATSQKKQDTANQAPPPPSSEEAKNLYFDFDDIPIPNEMELDSDDSILFESPELKAGVVVFKGRVEAISLFDFFLNNMPQENWHLRSYFKYGRYIMVFEKPDKDCIIQIKDDTFKTELQIWVTPRFPVEEDKMSGPDLNQDMETDLVQ
ncbi:MAG: hypothetical protein ACQES5_00290 [Thermodesulfobacteriota bacterium]